MNIGYFNAQGYNGIEHWFELEQEELKKRGHFTRMFWIKGNRPSKKDVDWMNFAHYHFAQVALFYRRLGVPYCISPHTNDIFPDNGGRLKIAAKHPNCKFVTYQSRYHKEHFEMWDIPEPYVHLPMCCRTGLFKREKPLGDNIIAGGRLVPRKGLEELTHIDNVVIFGEGTNQSYVDKLKKLNPTSKFIGYKAREELRDVYGSGWLYLFPARIVEDGNRDGIPNTIKEALLMGMQVIASPVAGIPEMKGVTLLDDWSDINNIVDSIPREVNKLGRQYILDNFSPEVCIDKLEKAIHENYM